MQPTPNTTTLWQRLASWFKTFQRRWNDSVFTPLAVMLFVQIPGWVNRWWPGGEFHGFSVDTLNALPTSLVCFCFAHLTAYFFFWVNHKDLFDEWTRCNEQDLLKKVVSDEATAAGDPQFITHLQSRHAWRIHTASQSILFQYFWASVLLQAVIVGTVPLPH